MPKSEFQIAKELYRPEVDATQAVALDGFNCTVAAEVPLVCDKCGAEIPPKELFCLECHREMTKREVRHHYKPNNPAQKELFDV
jgi:predicted amidophosphoribosyltransferase